MKLIFSKDGVKRELHTPFALCMGRDDLEALIRHLQGVHGSMLAMNHSYGWVRVDPSHPDPDSLPNTPPQPWKNA